jgi:hypothetical protein
MTLRLRSRGLTVFLTYQSFTAVKRLYAEQASEILGQFGNVIYLRQPDLESAAYAAEDLGRERTQGTPGDRLLDRLLFSAAELMDIPLASPRTGVHGIAKSPRVGEGPWVFTCPPEDIEAIPRTRPDIPEYIKW